MLNYWGSELDREISASEGLQEHKGGSSSYGPTALSVTASLGAGVSQAVLGA